MSTARANTAKTPVCACVFSEGIAGGSPICAVGGDYSLINARQNQLADAAESIFGFGEVKLSATKKERQFEVASKRQSPARLQPAGA